MRYLFMLIASVVVSVSYAQTSHYDSLYQQGLISKEDYELLKPKTDSTKAKIAHYDSLYKSGQLSEDDYNRLKTTVLVKRDKQQKVDIGSLMKRAKKQTTAGAFILGLGFAMIIPSAIISDRAGKVSLGTIGGAVAVSGLSIMIHGIVLRHRAKKLIQ